MRGGNAGSHVRISKGNIISNQPIMIGSDSHDEQPRVESRLEHRGKERLIGDFC